MMTTRLLLGSALVLLAIAAAADGAKYVCPPCGLPCDGTVYDAPGSCPKCGMTLVDRDTAQSMTTKRTKVGILIFDGVQIIDYTGPYEIFQSAGYDVYTVAASKGPITTVAGMTVVPRYAFADAPPPDILVVPGGGIGGALGSAATIDWIRATAGTSRQTMSVCNGAFILAKAGLLDGLTATTTNGNVGRLRSAYPKVNVVDDKRYVDNGKIMTTGGLTAGIDGALHVVAKLDGLGIAQSVALGEEYDWHPGGGFVRGTLADTNLMPWLDTLLDGTGTWTIARTEGGTDRWEVEGRGTSKLQAQELMADMSRTLTTEAKWAPVPGSTGRFTFTGRDGKPWTAAASIDPVEAHPGTFVAKLRISRAS
jgi:putative intracellular protease/amidase